MQTVFCFLFCRTACIITHPASNLRRQPPSPPPNNRTNPPTGTLDCLSRFRPRPATEQELARVHSLDYIATIKSLSGDSTKGCHRAGDAMSFSPGAFQIASLAAGAAIGLVDCVMAGSSGGGAGSSTTENGGGGGGDGGASASDGFGVRSYGGGGTAGAAANGGADGDDEEEERQGGHRGQGGDGGGGQHAAAARGPAGGAYGLVRPPGHHAERSEGMG
jgi:hypothetical protein